MTKRKMMPLEELRALCGGKGLSAFYVEAKTPEEETRLKSEIAYLEGRFSGLSQEEQEKCHWRAAAVIYANTHFEDNLILGQRASDALAGGRLGCSHTSLRRWRHQITPQKVGPGYWHLLLQPVIRQQHNMAPAAHRLVTKMLMEGQRPSAIAKAAESSCGEKVSISTIRRIRGELEQIGTLRQVKFTNRFK